MAYGDRGIAVQQQQRHRFADDIAASDDNGVPAGNRDLLSIEQLDDARGRAGDQNRAFLHEHSDVDRRQSVDVLLWRDGIEDALVGPGTHRLRQRRLNEDAVMRIAAIQLFDERDGVRNAGCCRQAFEVCTKAYVCSRLQLVADVHLGRRVLADQHDAETGGPPVLRPERRHFRANLLLHRSGERLAVEHPGGHATTPFSRALTLSVRPSTTSSSPGRMIASGGGLNSMAPPARLIPTTITPNFWRMPASTMLWFESGESS